MGADGLVANLESPLPATLPAGTGSAVYCTGTCFARHARVRRLAILVDGVPHRPAAFAMPRPDIFRLDPDGFRSGFWGTVPVPPRAAPGTIELELAARLEDGSEHRAPLGRIAVVDAAASAPAARRGDGLIAVCMATYDPDPARFERQIASLRAQTDRRWTCVISDDGSAPERWRRIAAAVEGDERFSLSRAPVRGGFYGNFERALGLVPADAELVALCDQDDVWHPDKLAVLRGALGDARLVYSDQRLVDEGGRVLRSTLWIGRRNNHTDLASLLVANTITGASMLMRREVVELALPFPVAPGVQFHDHWLALVALASGDVAYVDRPLYDYVQHGEAVFGRVADLAATSMPWWQRLARGGRGAYFLGYAGREVLAQTLLVRCRDRLDGGKRRALRRFVAAGRRPGAFAWLALRPLRSLAGRSETLGSEAALARGIAWRWLVATLAARARRPGRLPLDASFPDPGSFRQRRLQRWRARI